MTDELRTSLWNWLLLALKNCDEDETRCFYRDFLKWPINDVPYYGHDRISAINTWFMGAQWFDACNAIENVMINALDYRVDVDTRDTLIAILETEMSAYRWISGGLVPITNPQELESISQAAARSKSFSGPATHINAAIGLIGRRPAPDYRNSIKESISAVEASAKLLTGEASGGIDKAIAILEKRNELHPALKSALSKLYGYTCDADGIRHPILDKQQTHTFDEATFMLVICSAFVNLLLSAKT